MSEIEEILKVVLSEIHQDDVIDCNQYQGEDFYELLKRVTKKLSLNKLNGEKN